MHGLFFSEWISIVFPAACAAKNSFDLPVQFSEAIHAPAADSDLSRIAL